MGIPCPILNAGYTQWVISVFTMHDQFCPPVPAPLKCIPGLVEGPWPMGNPAGTLSHKKAMNVLVDGNPGIKQGHDVGYLIPHFAIPMNAMCALNMAFSKHKVMIPVSNVKIGGSPAGTYLAFLLGEICCNPVSMPTGIVLLFKCTVWTSPSLLDFVKGLLYMAVDTLFDLLWKKFFGKIAGKLVERLRSTTFALILCGFLRFPNLASKLAGPVIAVLSLRGMQTVVKNVLPKLAEKTIDHMMKSWVVGPLITGGVRGSPSVGRGDYGHKFFDAKWW